MRLRSETFEKVFPTRGSNYNTMMLKEVFGGTSNIDNPELVTGDAPKQETLGPPACVPLDHVARSGRHRDGGILAGGNKDPVLGRIVLA